MTRNITLSVDEEVLEAVKVVAVKQRTSVNAMVRDYLTRIAKANDRKQRARDRLLDLARESNAEVGEITWTRDDLYER